MQWRYELSKSHKVGRSTFLFDKCSVNRVENYLKTKKIFLKNRCVSFGCAKSVRRPHSACFRFNCSWFVAHDRYNDVSHVIWLRPHHLPLFLSKTKTR